MSDVASGAVLSTEPTRPDARHVRSIAKTRLDLRLPNELSFLGIPGGFSVLNLLHFIVDVEAH